MPSALPAPFARHTITYWAELNQNVAATLTSFSQMACYQELERRTGVRPIFLHPPAGSARDQFDQLIASGAYPDVIEWDWLHVPGGPAKAFRDGIIISLNELVAQHAPNLSRLLAQHPEWRRLITTDTGDLYCFPFIRGDRSLVSFAGLTLRQDWLANAALAVPGSIPAWQATLEALRAGGPSGSRSDATYPLTTWLFRPNGAFDFNAFIGAWGMTTGFYNAGGTVKFGPLEPAFSDFLQRMRDWYQGGLIDPESFSMDGERFDSKLVDGQLGAAVLFLGSGIGRLTARARAFNPDFLLAPAPFPALEPGGLSPVGYADQLYPGTHSAAITTANTDPAATVRWLDYGYSQDGGRLFNFGIEGESYTLERGEPRYRDAVLAQADLSPAVALSRYCRATFGGPFVQDPRYLPQYLTLPEQRASVELWAQAPTTLLLPPLTPTEAEGVQLARIRTNIQVRLDAMLTQVISGAAPLRSWERFADEARRLGIEQATAIQQAALARFNARM